MHEKLPNMQRVKLPIIIEANDKFYDTFIFRENKVFVTLKDQMLRTKSAMLFTPFFGINENETQFLSQKNSLKG